MEFKMRLSDEDEAKLVALEAWYHGLARAAVVRLAIVELHRYAVGAKRRKEEAAVLAQHMGKPAKGKGAAPTVDRPWCKEYEEVQFTRRMRILPKLSELAVWEAVDELLARRKVDKGAKYEPKE